MSEIVRTINISLEDARSLYHMPDFEDLALKAFSKDEIESYRIRPKTWEEYCKITDGEVGDSYYISPGGKICPIHDVDDKSKSVVFVSEKEAKSFSAFIKLKRLRDYYRDGWDPSEDKSVAAITLTRCGNFDIAMTEKRSFLSFKGIDVAEEFVRNFNNIILEAKEFI